MNAPSSPPSTPPSPGATAKRRVRRLPLLLGSLALTFLAGLGWWWGVGSPQTPASPTTALPVDFESDAGAPTAEHLPRELHGDRVLEGHVQDDLGNSIASAVIRIASLDEPDAVAREVRSDESGRFRVADLPAHMLVVEASSIGHDVTERALQAHDTGTLTLVLQRQGELFVALRDAPGNSVTGAEVLLTGTGVWPAATCTADERGECLFRALPFGQYQVRARHADRVALPSASVEVTPGQRTRLELTLQRGAQLSGVVRDSGSHVPLEGARVAVVDLTPGLPPLYVESGKDGTFALQGLWPGLMRLDVTRDGYAPESQELRLPVQDPLSLRLNGAVSLRGRVVDERGRPVRGATISVSTRDGLPSPPLVAQRTGEPLGELGVTQGPVPRIPLAPETAFTLGALAGTSDRNGEFHIEGLKPGSIVLRASQSGFAQATLVLDQLESHTKRDHLQLVLRDAGRVEGRIVDERGHGLEGVYVSVLQAEHTEQSSITNGRGEFVLRDVLGELTVQVQVEGREPLTCKVHVPARGAGACNLTIAGELYELPVRVVDEYGLGLEGALISARSKAERRTFSQVTQRDGRARLRELPAPPYRLRVDLSGYLPLVDTQVDAASQEVRVTLRRAARITGLVVDAVGAPVPRALINTDDEDVNAESDAQGHFSLTHVAPGPVTLWAIHSLSGESPAREVRARPGETLADVRLVLPKRFTGEVFPAQAEQETRAPEAPREQNKPAEHSLGLEQRSHAVVVTALVANGPAGKAGFKVGDVVSEIDGEAVLSVAQARGMLRDPANTAARVQLIRGRQRLNVRYKRPPH